MCVYNLILICFMYHKTLANLSARRQATATVAGAIRINFTITIIKVTVAIDAVSFCFFQLQHTLTMRNTGRIFFFDQEGLDLCQVRFEGVQETLCLSMFRRGNKLFSNKVRKQMITYTHLELNLQQCHLL